MTRRMTRATALFSFLVLLRCPASAQTTTRLQEFRFAVGAGGFSVNDTGRSTENFSTGGFHAFFEVALDPGVLLQVRYESFQLPGTTSSPPFQPAVSGPRIDVDAGLATVAYVFRETWWEAGLFAGVGLYGLAPRTPEAGQTAVDVRETVIGYNGGTLIVLQLARRWDLRVEAAGYLLRVNRSSHNSIKLLQLGGSVAYHF